MGRPRSFDEADVLQRAMDCFWTRGYEASSLDDLCGAMGISRSSFYQCFGNKHDLLLATLDRYGDETMARMQATFAAGRSFRDSLAAFLEAAVADAGAAVDGGPSSGVVATVRCVVCVVREVISSDTLAADGSFEKVVGILLERIVDAEHAEEGPKRHERLDRLWRVVPRALVQQRRDDVDDQRAEERAGDADDHADVGARDGHEGDHREHAHL